MCRISVTFLPWILFQTSLSFLNNFLTLGWFNPDVLGSNPASCNDFLSSHLLMVRLLGPQQKKTIFSRFTMVRPKLALDHDRDVRSHNADLIKSSTRPFSALIFDFEFDVQWKFNWTKDPFRRVGGWCRRRRRRRRRCRRSKSFHNEAVKLLSKWFVVDDIRSWLVRCFRGWSQI